MKDFQHVSSASMDDGEEVGAGEMAQELCDAASSEK